MLTDKQKAGKQIERAERALADAIEAGDGWAERQNRKAVRAARAAYGRACN